MSKADDFEKPPSEPRSSPRFGLLTMPAGLPGSLDRPSSQSWRARVSRRFIARQNVEHFQRLLRHEQGSLMRMQLERLLSEAQGQVARLQGIWTWTCPHLGIPDLLGAAAEILLDTVVEAQGADFGSLQVWDDGTRSLRLMAHCNFADQRNNSQS